MSAKFKNLKTDSLPSHWSADFFGNLVDYKLGKTPPRASAAYWKEGKYPWVSISDMTPHGVVTETAEKVSQAAYDTVFRGKLIPEGSLLMSFKLTIGRMSRLGIPAFHNEAIISFQPDPEKLSDVYLSYYLSQINYKDYQDTAIKGQTLNKGKLSALEIALPPLPEQKKIAHILSTMQRAIEAQERIIQTTSELKKALMHKLFTEGLRHEPQKQTEIGPVPESWATPTVESVCTIKASAMSYSQLEKASNVSDGVRVIGIKVSDMNLPGNEIEFRSANLEGLLTEKEARKRTVPPHSIIFPKRGAAIATNKKRLTTGYTVLDPNLIAVMPSEAVNHRYLFHWFNTFDLRKITDPGPTPQLNKKDIAPLKFPMPPIEEQEAIAAAIDAAEEKATLHIRKRDQFQDLFRTLLHELMTAKTRVHELEINA